MTCYSSTEIKFFSASGCGVHVDLYLAIPAVSNHHLVTVDQQYCVRTFKVRYLTYDLPKVRVEDDFISSPISNSDESAVRIN